MGPREQRLAEFPEARGERAGFLKLAVAFAHFWTLFCVGPKTVHLPQSGTDSSPLLSYCQFKA